jgi:23S rRNA pseudouridine1911/1915/1917 synthase
MGMAMPEFPPRETPYRTTTAAGQHPLRIDRYLQQILPAISRHKVHELIESGLVLVSAGEGTPPRPVKKSFKIGAGVMIEIYFRDQRPQDIEAEDISLEIAYEDEHLLVVNKPAGMVTHPAHGHFSGTLVNALMHHLGGLHPAGLDTIRPGIVHRLDKGTSGLLVVAKTDFVHRRLTEQFSVREVKREYRALVWGRFRGIEGTIDAPLGRHPGDRKRFAVVRRGGKSAFTTYAVKETFREVSYLALRLGTGRTHQIRVHLTHEGHPIFGDAEYGGRTKRLNDLPGSRKKFYDGLLEGLDHPALHARTLGFVHPVTSEALEFAAELPPDFANVLNLLRKDVE